jgi:hypothetical protein
MCPDRTVAPLRPELPGWAGLTLAEQFLGLPGTVPSRQVLRALLKKGKLVTFSFVGRAQARSLVSGAGINLAHSRFPKWTTLAPNRNEIGRAD